MQLPQGRAGVSPNLRLGAGVFLRKVWTTPVQALAAEFMGKNDSNPSDTQKFTEFIRSLIQKYYTVLLPRASVPSPINGKDLINEFGMKPSAEFKQILARVEEERLTKQTFTREEAIKLVKKLLNQR